MTHLHHRKLRRHCTKEERNAPWNLLEVTPELHRYIHENVAESYERGWLVRSWQDPREIGVEPHPELRVVTEELAA